MPGGNPPHPAAEACSGRGRRSLRPSSKSRSTTLRQRIADRAFFHDFVRAMFFHRRKFLRSELLSLAKDRLGKPEVDALLAGLNLDGTARAESLDVDKMLALGEHLRQQMA